MNFTEYFANDILNGTKTFEIRKKPQLVNQWIPIVVNGITLGEMVLDIIHPFQESIYKYHLEIIWDVLIKKYFLKYTYTNINCYGIFLELDKPHFDFYSNYFDGTPIYIYNIKEVRRL